MNKTVKILIGMVAISLLVLPSMALNTPVVCTFDYGVGIWDCGTMAFASVAEVDAWMAAQTPVLEPVAPYPNPLTYDVVGASTSTLTAAP